MKKKVFNGRRRRVSSIHKVNKTRVRGDVGNWYVKGPGDGARAVDNAKDKTPR